MDEPVVSIVIPCFDEAHRLEACFEGLDRARAALPFASEAVVVDDGSSDGTLVLAQRLAERRDGVRVLAERHRGKGGAVRAGALAARGAWIVMADADWSLPPESLAELLPPRAPDAALVIACRESAGARRVGEPEHRHLMGRVFNTLVQRWLLPGIEDSQCGYKAFDRDAARELFGALETNGWAFDVELLVRARQLGLPIASVPVTWAYRDDSRVQKLRDTLRMSRDLLRLRRRLGPAPPPEE